METKIFVIVIAVFCVGALLEARDIEDVILINLLEGQRLEIVCPKYFKGSVAYDPLLKFRNSSRIDAQYQLAIGESPRFDAPPDLKISASEDGNSFTYSFESVDASKAGEYSCDQKDTKDFFVTVFSGDSLRCPEAGAAAVAENDPFTASCGVAKAGVDGIVWPRDFFVMLKGDKVVATDSLDKGGRITIINAETAPADKPSLFMTRDDHRAGTRLTCVIPSLGLRCDSAAPNVTWNPDVPKIVDVPAFLRKGASEQLRCVVDDLGNPPMGLSVEDVAHPEAVVNAIVDGKEIVFTYQTAAIVEMTNASIRCSAGNVSEDVSFIIAEGPESVRPNKEEITVDAGKTFSMSCEAVASNPDAIIIYAINDEKILAPESIVARPTMDGGAVSCQAHNPLTRAASPIAQVPIKVRFFASVEKAQKDRVLFKSGDDVSIACPFRGNPAPSFSWFSNSNDSSSDSNILISPSSLIIFNASSKDAGFYSCHAFNDLGSDNFTVQLVMSEESNAISDSEDSPPVVDDASNLAVVIPIVIVVIILVAAVVAFLLRRKAVAGKMDVEKGNREIRDFSARDEDATLLEKNDQTFSGAAAAIGEETCPTSGGEDESFVITESEPMTLGDEDVSMEDNQEASFVFDSQPPNKQELRPGDERL